MNWIQWIKSNENEALAHIYSQYKTEAVAWTQKEYGCPYEEALDLFQASVVILYDNVISGKLTTLTTDIKTYLFGIIRNKSKEWLRSKQKQPIGQSLSFWTQYVHEEDSGHQTEEYLEIATNSLNEMGDPCKSLLQLFYYGEKTMDEITRLLGYKNADTTKNQKYKCLKRLQIIFSKHIQKTPGLEK